MLVLANHSISHQGLHHRGAANVYTAGLPMSKTVQSPSINWFLVRCTKTHQLVGRAPVLPSPEVPGHPADSVTAYHLLLAASPTTSPDQHILTYLHWGRRTMVTSPIMP